MSSSSDSDDSSLSAVQSDVIGFEEAGGAPRYRVPPRRLAAVEMPAVVENIDRAVNAFGRVPDLSHVMDPLRNSLPLYLNPESPSCPPIMSHNARSHNVVLKVTVPKRTGRKRKRGSNGPWLSDVDLRDTPIAGPPRTSQEYRQNEVHSIARLDEPKSLRRKLEDNLGKYQVEAVGLIKHTHRFRALADFHWDMNKSPFAQRYVEQVLPGNIESIKKFAFEPGIDRGPNVDIIPPPMFTHMALPFNYSFAQNPYVRATGDGGTVNLTAVKQVGYFIGVDDPAPDGPQHPPNLTDPRVVEVMAHLDEAFQERPVWTRRSLLNHLGDNVKSWNELKKHLNYAAYQFKGGPWRDSVVPYGVDPRTDPKYRIYQTLMFKLALHKRSQKNQTWQSVRKGQDIGASNKKASQMQDSHIFDGESYHSDGKVWQVCDITDPMLKGLFDNASTRSECDANSGWYHGGLWIKVKGIMKTKLVAIQFDRRIAKEEFDALLAFGDQTPPRTTAANVHLPVPNLHLTKDELAILRGRDRAHNINTGYNARFGNISKASSNAGPSSATAFGNREDEADSNEGESASEAPDDNDEGDYDDIYNEGDYYDQDVDEKRGYEEDEPMDMGHVTYPELD